MWPDNELGASYKGVCMGFKPTHAGGLDDYDGGSGL